jgi:hypothetical protein
MPTALYQKMVADLLEARKIAYRVPLYQCNTVVQELKIKSLMFLSHAIIEEYIETVVLDTAQKAVMIYDTENRITRALIGLISSGLIGRVEESGINKKIKKEPFENISLFSSYAFGRFKSLIGDNNGIRVNDQMKMLLPVGIDPGTEDPVTMAALDSFGGKRGAIAHTFKIAKSHTLSEIEGDIATIRSGLLNYDNACLAALI